MPDPQVVQGQMGGPIEARRIAGNCRGYVSAQPNHVIQTPTGFRNLRFVVNAPRDSTLVVMLPSGRIVCDDDGGEGMNPLIETSTRRGRIAVWVGAYSRGSIGTPYTLGYSELNRVTASSLNQPTAPVQQPPVAQSSLMPQLPPAFGVATLNAGFMPDPHLAAGTAGGSIRATSVGSACRGYVTAQPSHLLMSSSGFRYLRVLAHSSIDTTLVVQLPNGQFVCNDDGGNGLNPLAEMTNVGPGQIRVWVGTYSSTASGPYTIGFSELRNVGTANLPLPGQNVNQPMVTARPPVVVQPPVVTARPPVVAARPPVAVRPPVAARPPVADTVQMQVSIPVTLVGPGMAASPVALWQPGGAPVQVVLLGRQLQVGGANIISVPPAMPDPVVTVMQTPRSQLFVRIEQVPQGAAAAGQQMLLLIENGPTPRVARQWTGSFGQRIPRWARRF